MSDAETKPHSDTQTQPPAQTGASEPDAPEVDDDHLATVRVAALPPVPRPPPPGRISAPPPVRASPSVNNGVHVPGLTAPSSGARPAQRTRSSWMQSLLTPKLSPSGAIEAERLNPRFVALIFAIVAVVLGISALFVGLSGPPADSPFTSGVLSAVVLARALMGLGMLAAALFLLRMSERLMTSASGRQGPQS